MNVASNTIGDVRWVDGKFGKAIEFSGEQPFAPQLVALDQEIGIPFTDYAISFWMKTTSNSGQVLCMDRDSGYNNVWVDHIIDIEDGKLRVAISGDEPIRSEARVDDGQWHHVISTLGGAAGPQTLYIDGKPAATGKATRRAKSSTTRPGIDLGPGGTNGTLTIDDLRVHEHALSSNEIAGLKY